MNIDSNNLVDSNLPREYLEDTNHQVIKFQPKIIFIGLLLLVSRFFNLLSNLRDKDKDLINRRLNTFIEIYFWLPFFINYLSKSNSNYILTSNDHNQSNRTLILAAQALDIKTVYIQHAAVSTRFHKLQFDYSFLDGEHAFQIYKDCETNSSTKYKPPNSRHVFLSGIKKRLSRLDNHRLKSIGLAVKEADDIAEIQKLVELLHKKNFKICIRFHPASSSDFIEKIKAFKKKLPDSLLVSDPRIENVRAFFENISTVIGSNSTIHLEARLCGLKSIYYIFGSTNKFDYYGFVSNGISIYLEDLRKITNLIEAPLNNDYGIVESLRFYSQTYQTEWFLREGDLMANHLINIINKKDITKLFGYRNFDT